jgi:cytolysin (calcineurin-like family phosphatase)
MSSLKPLLRRLGGPLLPGPRIVRIALVSLALCAVTAGASVLIHEKAPGLIGQPGYGAAGGPNPTLPTRPGNGITITPIPPIVPAPKPPAPVVPPKPVEPPKPAASWFVVTSDPQYPWTPRDDGEQTAQGPADDHAWSRQLITEQYDSINRFTQGKQHRATFINGDLTAFGHQWQIDYMKSAIAKLRGPVYLGLGNHDYENNVDQCFTETNRCVRGSVYWYLDHMSRLPLDAFDVQVWNYYQFPHNREEIHGSLGWVKTFGNLVVVQLNNYASYTTTASGFSASRGLEEVVNVTASLGWLEQQLHRARMQGKAVVVMKHAPTIEPLFDDIIDKYNVSAVFVGHHHESLGATREPVGRSRTPSFYSGGASQRSYLVLENVDNADTELRVHAVRGNNPEAKTYAGSIPLKRHVQYAVPNDYPVEVRVHNQGAYEGGYWLTYSLGNRKHTASRYLHMGQGHTFEVPAGARGISLEGGAYTGVLWHKWDHIFAVDRPGHRDTCIKTWGTTWHNASADCGNPPLGTEPGETYVDQVVTGGDRVKI